MNNLYNYFARFIQHRLPTSATFIKGLLQQGFKAHCWDRTLLLDLWPISYWKMLHMSSNYFTSVSSWFWMYHVLRCLGPVTLWSCWGVSLIRSVTPLFGTPPSYVRDLSRLKKGNDHADDFHTSWPLRHGHLRFRKRRPDCWIQRTYNTADSTPYRVAAGLSTSDVETKKPEWGSNSSNMTPRGFCDTKHKGTQAESENINML